MSDGIAVLGAGRMGSALARAFLAGKYQTTVWNRSPDKLQPLAAAGARVAASVADAVAGADLVIVNLTDYASSDAVLAGRDTSQALRGKTLVQLTSGSPGQARNAAAWAASHGIDYLDGAIMATPDLIGGADATILYAGRSEVFTRHRAALLAVGGNTHHVGEHVGHASALDGALLIVMWGAMFGALEGVATCEAEEVPLSAYTTLLPQVAQHIGVWVADTAKRVEEGRLAADAQTYANISAHNAAFRCLLELYRERRLPTAFLDSMRQVFDAAIAAGQSQDDFARLTQYVRRGGSAGLGDRR